MIEPTILFEDSKVVVIDKPAGLIVHSDGRTVEPSVAEWFVVRYPEAVSVGEPWLSPQGVLVPRPGIVHRLDRTTSGVMILARTTEAYAFLKQQFKDRLVGKEYAALVWGHPRASRGRIEREIVRIKSTPPRWGVSRGMENKKRAAITEWEVRERLRAEENDVALLIARPKTGRTHQIRVHLQSIGHPIVGDHLYAGGRPAILSLTRPALHAERLTFTDTVARQRTFEAPYPADFLSALTLLRKIA